MSPDVTGVYAIAACCTSAAGIRADRRAGTMPGRRLWDNRLLDDMAPAADAVGAVHVVE